MCRLAILDHSGKFGCGHIFVAGVRECPERNQQHNRQPCVVIEETCFKPLSAAWLKYVQYIDPGSRKVAGPCQACKDDGWPNFF